MLDLIILNKFIRMRIEDLSGIFSMPSYATIYYAVL